MYHIDELKIKGRVNINVYRLINEKLVLEQELEDDNLVVTTGKELICFLLGDNTGNNNISQGGFGTDATAPAIGDTGLTDQYLVGLTNTSYPTTTSVMFEFELGLGEFNGNTINEYGLFSTDSVMFSRAIKTSVVKSNDIFVTGAWTITVA